MICLDSRMSDRFFLHFQKCEKKIPLLLLIKQVRSRSIQDRRQNVSEAHLRNKQSPCKIKISSGLRSCFAFTCQNFLCNSATCENPHRPSSKTPFIESNIVDHDDKSPGKRSSRSVACNVTNRLFSAENKCFLSHAFYWPHLGQGHVRRIIR